MYSLVATFYMVFLLGKSSEDAIEQGRISAGHCNKELSTGVPALPAFIRALCVEIGGTPDQVEAIWFSMTDLEDGSKVEWMLSGLTYADDTVFIA